MSEWIDFKQQQPKQGQTILFLCLSPLEPDHPDYYPPTYNSDCVKVGEFSINDGVMTVKDTYAIYQDDGYFSKFIAWQPLPQQPKGE
ncbi:hypothetical protein [Psychrobacter sp. I-STPA6b]|uniref:hypothetical protein n=1 Tax=Psychrobacter sp. I-STPA6b TaxID=2585718 RepID=UPI001D0C3252|nr:hypothetical protein [Psychrobacter sp. I-STPA6b]